jgi:hypothetical protein
VLTTPGKPVRDRGPDGGYKGTPPYPPSLHKHEMLYLFSLLL